MSPELLMIRLFTGFALNGFRCICESAQARVPQCSLLQADLMHGHQTQRLVLWLRQFRLEFKRRLKTKRNFSVCCGSDLAHDE